MAEEVAVNSAQVLEAPTFTPKERIVFGGDTRSIMQRHAEELEYWRWLNGGGDSEQAGEPEYDREIQRRMQTCRTRMAMLHARAADVRRKAALPQYNHIGPSPAQPIGKGNGLAASVVRARKCGVTLTEAQRQRLPRYARSYITVLERELEQALIRAGEAVPEERV